QTILVLLAVAVAGAPAITLAQDKSRQLPSYCPELQRLAGLAATKARFGSIAGNPREGNFRDTTLALAGWTGCSLYGATTYTCDSRAFDTPEQAEQAQSEILQEMKACLGEAWAEAAERSSSGYVVLHPATGPVSITLSTDQTDERR